jgi:hypothetical protein
LAINYRTMKWLVDHQVAVQAFSAVVITFLTIVLIILNVVYTRANWRIMRMMDADIRFKTQPIPAADVSVATMGMRTELLFIVIISTANAPLRLEEVSVFLTFADKTQHRHVFPFDGYRIVPIGDNVQLQDKYPATEFVTDYHTTVTYQDLGGSTRYITTFIPASRIPGGAREVITTRVIPPKGLISRAVSKFKRT